MRTPDISAVHKIKQAVKNQLVHERDSLADETQRLQSEVDELRNVVRRLQASRTRIRELICDGCGATLTVSSSTDVSDEAMRIAIVVLAWQARWSVSPATADELRISRTGDIDTCTACCEAK